MRRETLILVVVSSVEMKGNPYFPLLCPTCGQGMVYLLTAQETHVYECKTDGLIVRGPDGSVRLATPQEAIRLLLKPETE